MPVQNEGAPVSRLDPSMVRDAIKEAEANDCKYYAALFAERRDSAENDARDFWALLASVSGLQLSWGDQSKEPLWPLFHLDEIEDTQLRALADLSIEVGDSELIARCCDVYWVRCAPRKRSRGDIKYVEAATTAYLQSARMLEDPANASPSVQRIKRVLAIARNLSRPSEKEAALTLVEEMLHRHEGRDSALFSLSLMRILISHNRGDAERCIEYCDRAAATQETAAVTFRKTDCIFAARNYLDMQIRWMKAKSDDSRIPQVHARIARDWELAANLCVPHNYQLAAHHQSDAVKAWKHANDAPHAESAHLRLLELQRESVARFAHFEGHKIDLSVMAHAAIDLVEGKGFASALLGLFQCVKVPSLKAYMGLLKREREEGRSIAHLIQITQVNAEGKATAVRKSISDQDQNAMYVEVVNRVRQSQSMAAVGAILPCLRAFSAAHPLREEDVFILIADSPFVSQDRQLTIARAIHAGFEQDWLVVVHLIPPQIEHIIRMIFSSNNIVVSGLDAQGVQREFDLNTLLWMPEAEQILGADTLLDLRTLLIHSFGANLRNRMAHGLMNDVELTRTEIAYLWWLLARLVILGTSWMRTEMEASAEQSSGANTDRSQDGNPSDENIDNSGDAQ